MTIRVSVVVPTCRRPELLQRCLAVLIPPLAVYWRLVGAVRFRVFFL